jgi:hypothetical protein
MPGGLTRKFDYEKGKRHASVRKDDYRESIIEEGDNFDRGGKAPAITLSLKPSAISRNLLTLYGDDKQSLIRTLEGWCFSFAGEVGTISQLLRNPKVADDVADHFSIMKKSILRAEDIIGVAEHPQKKRTFYVLEFKCNLRPETPFPNPIFKKHLAFSVKFVGPASTT